MTHAPQPREHLEAIVEDYRHAEAEHRRARLGGTTRRRLERRLEELAGRFERVLGEWVPERDVRDAWRACLYHGAATPASPAPGRLPLAFRGEDASGLVVEVRAAGSGEYAVEVDGVLVETVVDAAELTGHHAPAVFALGTLEFHETFSASPEAIGAAAEWFATPAGAPPWEHAAELADDGLVDSTFGLTARGHRCLAQIREEVR